MSGVFISYRKEDTRPWAITLRDHLARALGERQVFFDVDSMAAGQWSMQIQRALDRCAVVVVLIGPRWMTATDADGRKRLFLPDDVHRLEVISALGRPDVTVIPVLVDGARLPQADDLPPEVRGILACQASEIGDARDARIASLRRLTRIVDGLSGQRRERRRAVAAASAAVVAGIANTLVVSNSLAVATAFLLASAGLGAWSFVTYRRMARGRMKGAWMALVGVILSAGMIVGSIVRLT